METMMNSNAATSTIMNHALMDPVMEELDLEEANKHSTSSNNNNNNNPLMDQFFYDDFFAQAEGLLNFDTSNEYIGNDIKPFVEDSSLSHFSPFSDDSVFSSPPISPHSPVSTEVVQPSQPLPNNHVAEPLSTENNANFVSIKYENNLCPSPSPSISFSSTDSPLQPQIVPVPKKRKAEEDTVSPKIVNNNNVNDTSKNASVNYPKIAPSIPVYAPLPPILPAAFPIKVLPGAGLEAVGLMNGTPVNTIGAAAPVLSAAAAVAAAATTSTTTTTTVTNNNNISSMDDMASKNFNRKVRNRHFAALSRQKHKEYVTSLEENNKKLMAEIEELKSENESLRRENMTLRSLYGNPPNPNNITATTPSSFSTKSIGLFMIVFLIFSGTFLFSNLSMPSSDISLQSGRRILSISPEPMKLLDNQQENREIDLALITTAELPVRLSTPSKKDTSKDARTVRTENGRDNGDGNSSGTKLSREHILFHDGNNTTGTDRLHFATLNRMLHFAENLTDSHTAVDSVNWKDMRQKDINHLKKRPLSNKYPSGQPSNSHDTMVDSYPPVVTSLELAPSGDAAMVPNPIVLCPDAMYMLPNDKNNFDAGRMTLLAPLRSFSTVVDEDDESTLNTYVQLECNIASIKFITNIP